MKKGDRHSPKRALFPATSLRIHAMSLLVVVAASPARGAPDEAKRSCVAAAEKGQELRAARKLLQAEELFRECAADRCPAAVRSDCRSWALALREEIPSIVVRAEDASGRELRGRVLVDGAVVRESYDGAPIPVDVGPHTVSVETGGGARATATVTALAGEQHRRVVALLPRPPRSAEGPSLAPRSSGPPVSAVLLGVVGAAALGSFAYFGLTGRSDVDHLRSTCAPRCASGDVDAARTRLRVADVSLGVGVVSLAAATWLWFGSGPRVDVRPSVAGVSLQTEF